MVLRGKDEIGLYPNLFRLLTPKIQNNADFFEIYEYLAFIKNTKWIISVIKLCLLSYVCVLLVFLVQTLVLWIESLKFTQKK